MLRIIIAHSVLIILDDLGVRVEVLVLYICKLKVDLEWKGQVVTLLNLATVTVQCILHFLCQSLLVVLWFAFHCFIANFTYLATELGVPCNITVRASPAVGKGGPVSI